MTWCLWVWCIRRRYYIWMSCGMCGLVVMVLLWVLWGVEGYVWCLFWFVGCVVWFVVHYVRGVVACLVGNG